VKNCSILAKFVTLLMLTILFPASCLASGKAVSAFLSSDIPRYREAHRHFIRTMVAYGYQASDITTYTSTADQASWASSARKIVSSKPDIVVAYGAPAVSTMLQEGDELPIVAADVVLPDGPTPRNLCGISARVPMITLLRTLQGMVRLQKVSVLFNSREAGSLRQYADICRASKQLGITMIEHNATSPASLEATITEAVSGADALIVTESSLICKQFERIAKRAKMSGIPVASPLPDSAKNGALVSLEISPEEQGRIAALTAIRLLDGVLPEKLGIKSPRKVDLVINMQVAKELDIKVPIHILTIATRILK
jgi:putative ABC transport system substrate-binding protein